MSTPKKRKVRVVAKRAVLGTDNIIFLSGEPVAAQSPVFVLPADVDSVEAMIEQDARAMMKLLCSWEDTTESHRNQMRELAKAALESKGISAPKEGGRK